VILILKVAVVVVVVLFVAGALLRFRKLRRDELRELARPVDRRLVSPPPSPYATSRGFRVVGDDGEPLFRPPVERPRLDPDRHYVFSELSSASGEANAAPPRHKDDWFLAKSAPRSGPFVILGRLVAVLVILAAAALVVAYYVHHHDKHHHPVATTTTVAPATLSPTAVSGRVAHYELLSSRYELVVSATAGSTRVSVQSTSASGSVSGWSGTLVGGAHKSFSLVGDARVSLATPQNATVSAGGQLLQFPSPLPATLVITLATPSASSTATSSTTTSLVTTSS